MPDDLLFAGASLSDVLRAHEEKMLGQIDGLPAKQVLETDPDALADYFASEYAVVVPEIDESEIAVSQGEEQIDVSRDYLRAVFDRSRPFLVTGTRITFHVPFKGDKNLFRFRPSTFSMNPPRGRVQTTELLLTYSEVNADSQSIKNAFDSDMRQVKNALATQSRDAEDFNSTLREKARARLDRRREKLQRDHDVATSFGFPIRRRDDAPQTYVVPTTRKRAVMPQPASNPAAPLDPALEIGVYEHVLSVVSNMVLVMERSPKAFGGMSETELRDHFLVQLNGQYEGQATGETFNFEGKTDILIRVGGRNIFIAECKFYGGPKSVSDAIDQLLGYATWRDSKLALLVFNRGSTFSDVVAKIRHAVRNHPSTKSEIDYEHESGIRVFVRHRDDLDKELTLTVMAFHIPS